MALFLKLGGSGLIIFLCLMFCTHNELMDFGHIKVKKNNNFKKEYLNPLRNHKVVITRLHIGFGSNGSVGIEMATPYDNKRLQERLLKEETRIKNDFIMSVNEEEISGWVKRRNFNDLKSEFIRIVNQYVDEPVKEVYISKFFYE